MDAFYTPRVARDEASLYEHCARALDVSLSLGTHGLPLMGTGDWNDGMNRVGERGQRRKRLDGVVSARDDCRLRAVRTDAQ